MSSESKPAARAPFRIYVMGRSLVGFMTWALLAPIFFVPGLIIYLSQAGPHANPLVGPAFIFGFLVITLSLIASAYTRVTVGVDGVLIQSLRKKRFLRFVDLALVKEIEGRLLRLTLRSGEVVDVFTGREENIGKPVYEAACLELERRIRVGIEALAPNEDEDDEEDDAEAQRRARLADRALAARARSKEAGYRAAEPPSHEELRGLVTDARAEPEARVAAAGLLLKHADKEDIAALVRAVEETVDPELKPRLRGATAEPEEEPEEPAPEEETQNRRA